MKSRKFLYALLTVFIFIVTACGSGDGPLFKEVEEGQVADKIVGNYICQIPEGYELVTRETEDEYDYGLLTMGSMLVSYSKPVADGHISTITISSLLTFADYSVLTDDESLYKYLENQSYIYPTFPSQEQIERTTFRDKPALTYAYNNGTTVLAGILFFEDGNIVQYAQEGGTLENAKNDMQYFLDSLVTINEKVEKDPPLLVDNSSTKLYDLTVTYPSFLDDFSMSSPDQIFFGGNITFPLNRWSVMFDIADDEYLDRVEGNDGPSRSESLLNLML